MLLGRPVGYPRRVRVASLICSFILATACAVKTAPPTATESLVQPRQLQRPLSLPRNLTGAREYFAKAVLEAEDVARAFCKLHWPAVDCNVQHFDAVEVFSSQEALWQRVLQINRVEDAPMPTAGLAAALEGRVLLAVTPDVYREVAPDYAGASEAAWSRLLAHEIVHRLHVQVLKGDEDAMGPQWFYEGFAVLGADQQIIEPLPSEELQELLAWVKAKNAYSRYGALMQRLAAKIPLTELVKNAGGKEFESWLVERESSKPPVEN